MHIPCLYIERAAHQSCRRLRPYVYGPYTFCYEIGYWDVSQITDFSHVFDSKRNMALERFNAAFPDGMYRTGAMTSTMMFPSGMLLMQQISVPCSMDASTSTVMFPRGMSPALQILAPCLANASPSTVMMYPLTFRGRQV
mmetsp:Transcript_23564/g.34884  ORF Transcript_23564/g.34884 Transcript_23564/m.34884 type:complete len:140 (-) Transcript_23564:547-966(-)